MINPAAGRQGTSEDNDTASSGQRRRGSGSFLGAEESDEEIVFRGSAHDRHGMDGYQRLETCSGPQSGEEEKLKRKLKFFFMNPIEKYYATRKLPWKLCLQALKVFIVTAQLWIFAEYRYAHVNYYTNQQISLDHIFIQDWDQVREVHSYPPSTGKLAIYRRREFFKFVDYVVSNWKGIETDALGPFFRNSTLKFCVEHFKHGNISKDLSFDMDSTKVTNCIYLTEDQAQSFNSSEDWMHQNNLTMPWHAIEKLYIRFNLTSVTLKPLGPVQQPDCFQFKIFINFDNMDHDGQLPLKLDMEPVRLHCRTKDISKSSSYATFIMFLNLFVILLSLSSLLLCLRALLRAQLLKHEAQVFLSVHYNWTLTVNERMEFLNLWYVMICTNDCLIIMGSVIKQMIESRSIVGDMWDMCSLMLGTGNCLVWFGILRYLGFFKTYNVLILTMKGAAPNMFRFLICSSFLYVGFSFAGWVILGPYHFKFETLMSTSECLFSLINGDDMFATFSSIPMKSLSVWVYSRVYLYTFICLFIYVVLSLFISIIMDTYEIIKNYYIHGFPEERLEKFYASSQFDFSSGQYSGESVGVRLYRIARQWWGNRRAAEYHQIN